MKNQPITTPKLFSIITTGLKNLGIAPLSGQHKVRRVTNTHPMICSPDKEIAAWNREVEAKRRARAHRKQTIKAMSNV